MLIELKSDRWIKVEEQDPEYKLAEGKKGCMENRRLSTKIKMH